MNLPKYTIMIDFGNWPNGKKQPIRVCPECGRKGLRRSYTDGSTAYLHKGYRDAGMLHIVESCYIPAK